LEVGGCRFVRGEAVRCERERVCDKMGIYIYFFLWR